MTRIERWRLEPRDPWVFAGEPRPNDLHGRTLRTVPLPSTLAAAVRSHIVGHRDDLDAAQAAALLGVTIRGPWIERDGGVYVPMPRDVRVSRGDPPRVVRSALFAPREGDGIWRGGGVPASLGSLDFGSVKSRYPSEYVALRDALSLLLGDAPYAHPQTRDGEVALVRDEARVHVTIDPEHQTAMPMALYTSPGARYASGAGIGVEATIPPGCAAPASPLFILGGESRAALRREGSGFADYAAVSERYAAATERRPAGFKLMLVTPAITGDGAENGQAFIPRWIDARGRGCHPLAPDVPLELVAVACDGFEPVTGWNTLQRRSRPVRRAVPAGSVYWLRFVGDPPSAATLRRACEALWGAPLDTSIEADPDAMLAAPHHDGFGMLLPGFWSDQPTEMR